MVAIEKKLLNLFALFNWSALYRPFSLDGSAYWPEGKAAGLERFEPTFYIHHIRLFIHCGSVPSNFERDIAWGRCWRFLPGVPKPAKDNFCMRDLILQPALLSVPGDRGLIKFRQFKDLPGSPAPSEGMRDISKCEACGEWSPETDYDDGVCRACGSRDGSSEHVMLSSRAPDELQLINGWGEHIDLPETTELKKREAWLIFDPMEEKPQIVNNVSFWGLFHRLISGPPDDSVNGKIATDQKLNYTPH